MYCGGGEIKIINYVKVIRRMGMDSVDRLAEFNGSSEENVTSKG
jgi:hypothetical protein